MGVFAFFWCVRACSLLCHPDRANEGEWSGSPKPQEAVSGNMYALSLLCEKVTFSPKEFRANIFPPRALLRSSRSAPLGFVASVGMTKIDGAYTNQMAECFVLNSPTNQNFPAADGFGCRVHKRGATPFIRITKDRQLGCDPRFPVADGFGCRVHKRGATM